MQVSFKEYGLNKYENDAYLALVRGGACTASMLSKSSKVPHGKIYPTLESLKNKGFVKEYESRPRQFYAVEPKIVIEESIRRKEIELKEFKAKSKKTIKTLGPVAGRRPQEAVEKIRTIQGYRNYLNLSVTLHDNTKEEWLTISRLPLYQPLIDAYKRCTARGVKVRILAHVTEANKTHLSEWKKIGGEIRIIDSLGARFSVVDGHTVIMRISGEGSYLAMWVTSKNFAAAARKYFDFLWDSAKKI